MTDRRRDLPMAHPYSPALVGNRLRAARRAVGVGGRYENVAEMNIALVELFGIRLISFLRL